MFLTYLYVLSYTHTFWGHLFEVAVIVINASLLTVSAAFPNNILLSEHNTVISQEINAETIIFLNSPSSLKYYNFPVIPFIFLLLLWNLINGHILNLVLLSFQTYLFFQTILCFLKKPFSLISLAFENCFALYLLGPSSGMCSEGTLLNVSEGLWVYQPEVNTGVQNFEVKQEYL